MIPPPHNPSAICQLPMISFFIFIYLHIYIFIYLYIYIFIYLFIYPLFQTKFDLSTDEKQFNNSVFGILKVTNTIELNYWFKRVNIIYIFPKN